MTTNPVSTVHRDAPICPHCGHAQGDAWEIDFGPGIEGETTISCDNCEAEFSATRCCTVTYCTAKLPNVPAQRPPAKDV